LGARTDAHDLTGPIASYDHRAGVARVLWHGQDEGIASHGRDEGKPDSRVAPSRFNDGHAWSERASALGVIDERYREPVFDATGWIPHLELRDDAAWQAMS